MKRIIKTGLFTLFLTLSTTVFSQGDAGFINGVLLDSITNEPIVFATVKVKGLSLGVISNTDGSFQVPTSFQSKGDTLVVSSMGYETEKFVFSMLKKGVINKVFLKPSVLELQETIVTANKKRGRLTKVKINLTAEQIIKYAIERIPDNYDKNPFELVGYYRDYQLRKQKYTNLNEALIKVFDKGFDVKDYKSLQFGLYNYKSNLDFEVDSFATKAYDYESKDKYIPDAVFRQRDIPNELALLFIHDAIRNNDERTYSYVNTFVEDFIKAHDFITYFLTNYGDKEVYKIKFNRNTVPFQVKGDIYIDKDTYAIRRLDYAVYKQKPDKNSSTNYNESETDLLYEILLEYQDYNGYMYLNYISFHNKFKLTRPPEFFIEDVFLDQNTKQMILVLNKPAVNWLTLKNGDFRVYYEGSRLRIKEIQRVGYVGDTYALSFPRKKKRQRKRLRLLLRKEKDEFKASLVIVVNNMLDGEGNYLAERKSELIDQFREFFTQKIISSENSGVSSMSFVDKTLSLGNEEQLKIKMKVDEDFWMNTPLKSVTGNED